jgi:hypothetical protein
MPMLLIHQISQQKEKFIVEFGHLNSFLKDVPRKLNASARKKIKIALKHGLVDMDMF